MAKALSDAQRQIDALTAQLALKDADNTALRATIAAATAATVSFTNVSQNFPARKQSSS